MQVGNYDTIVVVSFEGKSGEFAQFCWNFIKWGRIEGCLVYVEFLYTTVYEMLNNEDRVLCTDAQSVRDFTAVSMEVTTWIVVVIDLYSCRTTYILPLYSVPSR